MHLFAYLAVDWYQVLGLFVEFISSVAGSFLSCFVSCVYVLICQFILCQFIR